MRMHILYSIQQHRNLLSFHSMNVEPWYGCDIWHNSCYSGRSSIQHASNWTPGFVKWSWRPGLVDGSVLFSITALRSDILKLFQQSAKTQATLEEILKPLRSSAASEGGIVNTRFWTVYERIAKQADSDFLGQYNSTLDVQLIFVGTFFFTVSLVYLNANE